MATLDYYEDSDNDDYDEVLFESFSDSRKQNGRNARVRRMLEDRIEKKRLRHLLNDFDYDD